jgi:hypothetical protein
MSPFGDEEGGDLVLADATPRDTVEPWTKYDTCTE